MSEVIPSTTDHATKGEAEQKNFWQQQNDFVIDGIEHLYDPHIPVKSALTEIYVGMYGRPALQNLGICAMVLGSLQNPERWRPN
ncbi:MAG: hypothetical protein KA604_02325 [Candidatus Saccharimonas sp.]|nr:hypothetical protein [Candidatus Saccharimonas sp.]